jgi:peptidoglycan hydrolase CwlO-like protein
MPTPTLTNAIIEAAIDGFEAQKQKINAQIAELRALLNGHAAESANAAEPATTDEPAKPPRRKMSAAGRRAIAAGQRKRWAAAKAEVIAPEKKTSKPKDKLSAAGRAAIVAALKKRWADKKAAAKK